MNTQVAIIGGGPAGMEAAFVLSQNGVSVAIFEAQPDWAYNVQNKFKLFPNFSSAEDLRSELKKKLDNKLISVHLNTEITDMKHNADGWTLTDNKQQKHTATAVLLATGYEVFDAKRKEELGYGIYNGVITSLNIEQMLKTGKVVNTIGDVPKRIVFLQCVGSRDEKVGNHYCSKVCCVTAVKQAIEIKKIYPETEIFVFYMDLRMWGQGFEEMYREAQEKYSIRFVRGRISEAAATFDGRVQIKSEDTLVGQPLKMSTDLLVLMVGMEASCGTQNLSKQCGINGLYGFAQSQSPIMQDNQTKQEGLFVAGTCKRPMSISDTLNDARSAALEILGTIKSSK